MRRRTGLTALVASSVTRRIATLLVAAIAILCLTAQVASAASGTISGTVIDAITTIPIQNANVRVYDSSGNSFGFTTTDSNGNYSITGLAAGSYRVRFSVAGYVTQYDYASVNSGVTTVVNAAMQTGGGTISGTVTDAVTTNPIR